MFDEKNEVIFKQCYIINHMLSNDLCNLLYLTTKILNNSKYSPEDKQSTEIHYFIHHKLNVIHDSYEIRLKNLIKYLIKIVVLVSEFQ